jgi:hypothetical protein
MRILLMPSDPQPHHTLQCRLQATAAGRTAAARQTAAGRRGTAGWITAAGVTARITAATAAGINATRTAAGGFHWTAAHKNALARCQSNRLQLFLSELLAVIAFISWTTVNMRPIANRDSFIVDIDIRIAGLATIGWRVAELLRRAIAYESFRSSLVLASARVRGHGSCLLCRKSCSIML